MKLHSLTHLAVGLSAVIASPIQPGGPSRSVRGTLLFSYLANITRVTIDNPPINLFDQNLASDFVDFLISIQPSKGTPPKVIIIDSADPGFFSPHIDLVPLISSKDIRDKLFTTVADIGSFLRNTTSTVFIAEIDGRASGFGDELFLQTDIRFAGPNTRVSQLEVPLGVFPGGGGAQALPRLINRSRALQYILSGDAADGPTAVKLGWVNEYFSSKSELRKAVEDLAKRIALYPANAINATKAALPGLYPSKEVYARDSDLFLPLVESTETLALINKYLQLSNNQTRSEFELGIPYTLPQLYQ